MIGIFIGLSWWSDPLGWIYEATATDFLWGYTVLIVIAFAMALVIRRWIPYWYQAPVSVLPIEHLSPDEVAELAGGLRRVVLVSLSRLYSEGRIYVDTEAKRPVARVESLPDGRWFDQEMLDVIKANGTPRDLRRVALRHQSDRRWSLVNAGLFLPTSWRYGVRFLSTVPFLIVSVVGTIRTLIGLARHEEVGFLIGLILIALAFAVALLSFGVHKTRAGTMWLRDQKRVIKRNPAAASDGLGWSVAVLGGVALPGYAADLKHLHDKTTAGANHWYDTAGGGGGDGGGGSGCGGCGGCGG